MDDEKNLLTLLTKNLKAVGHRIEKAGSGRAALRKIKAGHFDLVITDRAMPDMNGDKVARAVKEKSPGTRVIMLTGFGEMMKQEGQHPAGVDLLLNKPVTREQLMRAMYIFM